MSCGCTKSYKKFSGIPYCTCKQSSCEVECPTICTALVSANSVNVPACDETAVLSFPGLTSILIGSYLYNPTYGTFLVTGFNSINGQVTIENTCLAGNAAPGTMIPVGTEFVFGSPPTLTEYTAWTPVLTAPVGSTLTIPSQTVNQANYFTIGTTMWFTVSMSFEVGGADDDSLYMSLPITSVADDTDVAIGYTLVNNNAYVPGSVWRVDTTPTRLVLSFLLGTLWDTGAVNSFTIQGYVQVT